VNEHTQDFRRPIDQPLLIRSILPTYFNRTRRQADACGGRCDGQLKEPLEKGAVPVAQTLPTVRAEARWYNYGGAVVAVGHAMGVAGPRGARPVTVLSTDATRVTARAGRPGAQSRPTARRPAGRGG